MEEGSPLGAENILLEIGTDGIESSLDVEVIQEVEVSPDFSHTFVVVLIHGGGVDAEVASDLIEVIAGCS